MPNSGMPDFDPYSDSFFTDPNELYRHLRDEAPIFYDHKLDIWVVSRFGDVAQALRDWTTFSSARGILLSEVLNQDFDGSYTMITMDPPEHDRLRALMSRVFTPRAVGDLEPMIRTLIQDHLRPLESMSEFDVIEDFAGPFPANIISSLLGVPQADHEAIRHWIDAVLHRERGDPNITPEGIEAAVEAGTYFLDLAVQRRERPAGDLISQLCKATVGKDKDGGGPHLEDREVAGFVLLLAAAGTETVTKLLGSTFVGLEQRPDIRTVIAADPSLIPTAVEEAMRLWPPAQYVCRSTNKPAELPSGKIPSDSRVMLIFGAAMRDPRAFEFPDEFRLDRPSKPALGFGYGIHACLGNALARLESRIAIEEFLTRWPTYEVNSDGLVRVTQENTAGFCKVPVRVTPARVQQHQ